MVTRNKRPVSISRKSTVPVNREVEENVVQQPTVVQQPPQHPSSPTGGIALASAASETDPFKLDLLSHGYTIISEDEYGVVARQEKGKSIFMAKGNKGYLEPSKRNTVFLPESITTAMKICVASMNVTVSQYLTQLVMKDLKERNLL